MQPVNSVQAVSVLSGDHKGTPRLEQPKPADEAAQKLLTLRKASRDFESIFIARLLEPMVKSVSSMSDGGQFGGGVMLKVAAEKMAESIAGKGGVGLGEMLYESLKGCIETEATEEPAPETKTEQPFDLLRVPDPRQGKLNL